MDHVPPENLVETGQKADLVTVSMLSQADDVYQQYRLGEDLPRSSRTTRGNQASSFQHRGPRAESARPPPASIDNEYLSQFPEFVQFRERSHLPQKPASSDSPDIAAASVAAQAPDELLRTTIREIEAAPLF